jgi:uncharacterized protein involved in exopolysaccharide biosynthesis
MVMAVKIAASPTPRDRLERLVDYVRKARRYWWIVAGAIVLGAALSVVFAVTRPAKYKSWSVLFYQERIQSALLQGRQATENQRNIGERYRELLLSRDLLAKVVEDPAINPYPDELAKDGVDAAVEELRKSVALENRGIMAFRITYTDSRPGRAQKVTERLTDLLKSKENEIRDEQVKATAEFAETQKKVASEQMRERQRALSEFLAKHPEFAQEDMGGAGAGIRARTKRNNELAGTPSGNPRVLALERQRARIKARLDAPPGLTPVVVRTPRTASPARQAAEAVVAEAQREQRAAERALEEAVARGYTDKHPTVVKAREAVADAKQRVKNAQAAVPDDPDADPLPLAPATEADRAKLEKQLSQVEQELSRERKRDTTSNTPSTPDDPVAAVVNLEADYANLQDAVDEQRERVQSLADAVFRAQIDASQQLAEQGAHLAVVSPAFRPIKPFGSGKKILVLAGVALFATLGIAFALGLAIIDDRLYRRAEVEELGLGSVLAVIPAAAKPGKADKPEKPGKIRKAKAT